MAAPEIFQAIDNGWGRQGWTTMRLRAASEADVEAALRTVHVQAVAKKQVRRTHTLEPGHFRSSGNGLVSGNPPIDRFP